MSTKKVMIAENDLVNLIDDIVTEALAEKKAEWLAEEKKKWLAETQVKANKVLLDKIDEMKLTLEQLKKD